MTDAQKVYEEWLNHPDLDSQSKANLEAMADQPQEINESFYQNLKFGTAGLRGILGTGINRMNRYTVARAATAFAKYIASLGQEARERGIAISYDSRHYSADFARLSARIFCQHKINVRLSDELRPVPLLSFAIRHFNCVGGIVITASHNPKIYNGFKAYGEDGGQIPEPVSDQVVEIIDTIPDPISHYHSLPSEEEMRATKYWHSMGPDLDEAYDAMALNLPVNLEVVKEQKDLAIVYSPLHGSGNKPVRRLLSKMGFENVLVVPEQEAPNGDFPTAPYPNPEDPAAMQFGINLAKEKAADILIATDPDADRMGVALRDKEGEYRLLSGNQIGVLLLEYLLSTLDRKGQMPKNPLVISTVVSSRLPEKICAAYGVNFYRTLTGFKNIAEMIKDKEDEENGTTIFSYEESFGYLAGSALRDKDGVSSSMLMAEMAAYAASQGETVFDRLERIYQEYGYVAEKTIALVREGQAGQKKIKNAMREVRNAKQEFFAPLKVEKINDYLEQESWSAIDNSKEPISLNASNVLVYELGDGEWFATRPSGTEPKLKIYMGSSAKTQEEANQRLQNMEEIVAERITNLLD